MLKLAAARFVDHETIQIESDVQMTVRDGRLTVTPMKYVSDITLTRKQVINLFHGNTKIFWTCKHVGLMQSRRSYVFGIET